MGQALVRGSLLPVSGCRRRVRMLGFDSVDGVFEKFKLFKYFIYVVGFECVSVMLMFRGW